MPPDIQVKICGLRDAAAVVAAADAGARYLGFNFVAKSPRYVTFAEAAILADATPFGVAKVGLLVNPDDATLDALLTQVPLDFIQLHGNEPPARVSEVQSRTGLPVIKAVGVGDPDDLGKLDAYGAVADMLLVDTKPPQGAALTGGTGQTFDWSLVAGRRWPVPWMLAGGLVPQNVADAIMQTGTQQVDVSSGVETSPGVKDPELMKAFVQAAQTVQVRASLR